MTTPIPFDPDFDAPSAETRTSDPTPRTEGGLTLSTLLNLLAPKTAFYLGLVASVLVFLVLGFFLMLPLGLKVLNG